MMCYEVTFTCQGQLMEKKVYKHFTFTAECMWFHEIPKKEINNE